MTSSTTQSNACFLVDIGNSGLRVVRVPSDPFLPIPIPTRISWSSAVRGSRGEMQFQADDESWTEQLTPLIEGVSNSQWWIASVHRPATKILTNYLTKHPDCHVNLVGCRSLPIKVDVDFPERVGIDRLLAAYAAGYHFSERPLLVIQAGSAVTVDLLDDRALPGDRYSRKHVTWSNEDHKENAIHFLGGAILPGVPMMLRLLSSAADMLPEIEPTEVVELPPLPGRNSQAAMLAGVSSSLVGGVLHLVKRYRLQFGEDLPIVLSGGDGPMLAPHLIGPLFEVDHLVLQGLRLLTQK